MTSIEGARRYRTVCGDILGEVGVSMITFSFSWAQMSALRTMANRLLCFCHQGDHLIHLRNDKTDRPLVIELKELCNEVFRAERGIEFDKTMHFLKSVMKVEGFCAASMGCPIMFARGQIGQDRYFVVKGTFVFWKYFMRILCKPFRGFSRFSAIELGCLLNHLYPKMPSPSWVLKIQSALEGTNKDVYEDEDTYLFMCAREIGDCVTSVLESIESVAIEIEGAII